MARVGDLLVRKGSRIVAISPAESVQRAVEMLVENNIGSLLVRDGDAVIGIFTERDYLRRVALENIDSRVTRVREVMTRGLLFVSPDCGVHECMAIMTRERIRHLPVMEADRAVGMISIGDLVKHLSDEREVEVRALTDYITGRA